MLINIKPQLQVAAARSKTLLAPLAVASELSSRLVDAAGDACVAWHDLHAIAGLLEELRSAAAVADKLQDDAALVAQLDALASLCAAAERRHPVAGQCVAVPTPIPLDRLAYVYFATSNT
jgi:hypothetical protein